MAGIYKRLFARYYDGMMAGYEKHLEPRKRELFAGIEGTVLEVGPGTGANLRFLPPGARWIGVEPNPFMHDSLRARAREAGVEASMHVADARRIEVQDAVADVAISTLVLCSVPDVARTLSEIRRVLRPGGRFLFIEHVAAPRRTGLRYLQTAIRPVWRVFGDGCRIDVETAEAIERAGFREARIERFRVRSPHAVPWVGPHIAGQAVR